MIEIRSELGAAIAIGDGITITIVELNGAQVRIGIEAPRDVLILRTELAEQRPASQRTIPSPEFEFDR